VATRADASHAWLLVEDPLFEQRLVLEAAGAGFRLIPLSRFVRTEKVVALIEPAHPLDAAMPAAGEWLGEKYDTIGLVGMAWVVLGQLAGQLFKNPFRSRRSLFCSESVVRTLRAAGHPRADRLRVEDTTPAALLAFLSATPGARVTRGAALKLSALSRRERSALKRRAQAV
jgi:hypothetical protein